MQTFLVIRQQSHTLTCNTSLQKESSCARQNGFGEVLLSGEAGLGPGRYELLCSLNTV